jgi:hypothetical protein
MKTYSVILAALLVSGGIASAQQQSYDTLGSPTPRPNQAVPSNTVEPNVPAAGDSVKPDDSSQTKTAPSTTGSGMPADKPIGDTKKSGDGIGHIGGDDDRTPGGLTRD